jgi:hypothetical protein
VGKGHCVSVDRGLKGGWRRSANRFDAWCWIASFAHVRRCARSRWRARLARASQRRVCREVAAGHHCCDGQSCCDGASMAGGARTQGSARRGLGIARGHRRDKPPARRRRLSEATSPCAGRLDVRRDRPGRAVRGSRRRYSRRIFVSPVPRRSATLRDAPRRSDANVTQRRLRGVPVALRRF